MNGMKNIFCFAVTTALVASPAIASAQVTYYDPIYRPITYCEPQYVQFGTGNSGERMSVDRCSIQPVSNRSANFVYFLDNERIFAQAKCTARPRHWYTFDDRVNPNGQPVYPQSTASRTMLNYVCTNAGF